MCKEWSEESFRLMYKTVTVIKDTSAETEGLTLKSYLHNFQPEGWKVGPQGHFYLKPKGTCIKETGVNESLLSDRSKDTNTSIILVWNICADHPGSYLMRQSYLLHVYCYFICTWLCLIIIICTLPGIQLEIGHLGANTISSLDRR